MARGGSEGITHPPVTEKVPRGRGSPRDFSGQGCATGRMPASVVWRGEAGMATARDAILR